MNASEEAALLLCRKLDHRRMKTQQKSWFARSRQARDVGLLASVIRAELRAAIEKVTRDEVDEGWKLSDGPAKADPDRHIGVGI